MSFPLWRRRASSTSNRWSGGNSDPAPPRLHPGPRGQGGEGRGPHGAVSIWREALVKVKGGVGVIIKINDEWIGFIKSFLLPHIIHPFIHQRRCQGNSLGEQLG